VDIKFKKQFYPIQIQINELLELMIIEPGTDAVKIGSAVTLAKLEEFCVSEISKLYFFFSAKGQDILKIAVNNSFNLELSRKEGSVFQVIKEILHWFGGQQVRNVAVS